MTKTASLSRSFSLSEAIAYFKGDMGGPDGSFDAALRVILQAAEIQQAQNTGRVAEATVKPPQADHALIWRDPFGRAQ